VAIARFISDLRHLESTFPAGDVVQSILTGLPDVVLNPGMPRCAGDAADDHRAERFMDGVSTGRPCDRITSNTSPVLAGAAEATGDPVSAKADHEERSVRRRAMT
jgi:hypothetical protein